MLSPPVHPLPHQSDHLRPLPCWLVFSSGSSQTMVAWFRDHSRVMWSCVGESAFLGIKAAAGFNSLQKPWPLVPCLNARAAHLPRQLLHPDVWHRRICRSRVGGQGKGVDGQMQGYLVIRAEEKQAARKGHPPGGRQASQTVPDRLPWIACSTVFFYPVGRVSLPFPTSRPSVRATLDGLVFHLPGCSLEWPVWIGPSTCRRLNGAPSADLRRGYFFRTTNFPTQDTPTKLPRSQSSSSASVHDEGRVFEADGMLSV